MTLSIRRCFRRLGVAAVAVAAIVVQGMAAPKAISSFEELCRIGVDAGYPLDGEYELAGDIDASGSRGSNDGAGFLPIGRREAIGSKIDSSKAFTGKFDGKGYKVDKLCVKRTTANESEGFGIGLFGFTLGAEIRNLVVVADTVAGYRYVGALVGRQHGGVVERCVAMGAVVGGVDVGGLVGAVEGEGKIKVSYSSANVGGGSGVNNIGGLAGSADDGAEITESYAVGGVAVSDGNNVGGLVGSVGSLDAAKVSVMNCYSMAAVSGGASSVGGLAGKVADGSEIRLCYSAGKVSGSGGVGGLIGESGGMAAIHSSWDKDRSSCETSAGGPGAVGRSTAQMMSASVMSGFVAADTVSWGISNNYPYLKNAFFPKRALTVTTRYGGALSGDAAAGGTAHTQRVNQWIVGNTVTANAARLLISPDSRDSATIVESLDGWYLAGSSAKLAVGPYDEFSVAQASADGTTGMFALSDLKADSVAVEARFILKKYKLAYVAINGFGKVISQDSNEGARAGDTLVKFVEHGAVSSVKAEPNDGYKFLQWWADQNNKSLKEPVRADTALKDYLYRVSFSDSTIELTYVAGTGGRLRVNGSNKDTHTEKKVPYGTNGPSVEAVPNENNRFVMWDDSVTANPRVDTSVIASLVVTAIFDTVPVSVKSHDRVIPNKQSINETAVIRPVKQITVGLTAGPNPVSRQSGKVDLYWQGAEITKGTLRVFDANGNFVGKISISGINNNSINKQHIAAWTLTDAKGNLVGAGTYLIKGTLSTKNGKRERVALRLSLI